MSIDLQPLFEASLAIQLHVAGAVLGFFLGTIQMLAPKGTLPHKTIGVIWIVVMSVAVVSSIFIGTSWQLGIGQLYGASFIHLFTLLGLYAIPAGVILIFRGGAKLKHHARPFTGLYIGGLVVAGALSFAPGRLMHQIVFGG